MTVTKRFRFTYRGRVISGKGYLCSIHQTKLMWTVRKTTSDNEPLPLEIESLSSRISRQQEKTEWIMLLTSSILVLLHLSQVAVVISFHLVIEDFALIVTIAVAAAGNEIIIQDILCWSEKYRTGTDWWVSTEKDNGENGGYNLDLNVLKFDTEECKANGKFTGSDKDIWFICVSNSKVQRLYGSIKVLENLPHERQFEDCNEPSSPHFF